MEIIAATCAVLSTTPSRWLALTEQLPLDLLTRPPAPGEWSALECLQHLVDTERWVFPARVGYLLAGQDFPDFDPDSQGSAPERRAAQPSQETDARYPTGFRATRVRTRSVNARAELIAEHLRRARRLIERARGRGGGRSHGRRRRLRRLRRGGGLPVHDILNGIGGLRVGARA